MAQEHGTSGGLPGGATVVRPGHPVTAAPTNDHPDQTTTRRPRPGLRATLLSWYITRVPHHFGKSTVTRLLARLCPNQAVHSRYGVLLYPSPTDKTNTYALLGTYGVVADEVLRLEPGMCFIDVGANCGVFALMAAARVGPTGLVIAFEPSPREFASLTRNLAANGVENVLALPLAVCEQTGPIAFAIDPGHHSGCNAIAPSSSAGRAFGLHPADFPGLIRLVAGRRIVLKLDVEGYEVKALDALADFVRTQRVEKLIVEVDGRQLACYGDTPAALYARLDAFGYAPIHGATSHHYDEVFIDARRPARERAA